MMLNMRTTLTLDDDLHRELHELAHRTGRSFKRTVNETLRRGLASAETPTARSPYRVRTAALGSLAPGIDPNKMLQLADELEDMEIVRKLRAGK